MTFQYTLPDLENRFLPPENWRSDEFLNPETRHRIHYNFILPKGKAPKGIIIALPGLSEFGEKYIETAQFFLEKGYSFYVIDWAYQGRSTRYKDNPHKRHSDGYESDISDLDFWISNIIEPTSTPLYMIAHSMGGNIGLRYISKHSEIFTAASFSAPMLGIRDLKYTEYLTEKILKISKKLHHRYIPGGRNWNERERSKTGKDKFSRDPIRGQLHNKWCLSNPALQVGNPTLKWIYESLKSIHILKDQNLLKKIKTPVLLFLAEKEKIVGNPSIKKASKIIPNAKLISLKNSKHEILVEKDDVRNQFLNETLKFFNASS